MLFAFSNSTRSTEWSFKTAVKPVVPVMRLIRSTKLLHAGSG